MREWNGERIAAEAGATLHRSGSPEGPTRASIDSRGAGERELFFGLAGARTDGGRHAPQALEAGAWGVLVAPEHVDAALAADAGGAVLSHAEPLVALQRLAGGWRTYLGERGARVVAITGSTGKTSTKDILAALLGLHMRTLATRGNLNNEIGLPLTILAAGADTQALVLELAMRGAGQIAELTEIAAPDVGVIVNVGAAHLELLGSVEAVAAAKAELIAGMGAGTTIVVPVSEPLLEPHLRSDLHTVTFGAGGDVSLIEAGADGRVRIATAAGEIRLRPSFSQAHNLVNLLAAVAVAGALGVRADGPLEVMFSAMRGERVELGGGVLVIDDCYNANPMSMRAAINDLARTAPGRRVAVLGDMLELGPEAAQLHRALGLHARESGVDLVVSVGELAAVAGEAFDADARHAAKDARQGASLLAPLVRDGDTILVKGSRGMGLELVVQSLRENFGEAARDGGAVAGGVGPGQR